MSEARDILKGWPQVRLIQTPQEFDAVMAAARADGDNIMAPTHAVTMDGRIVGGLGLSPLPLARYWIARELKAWQSLNVISVAENLQRAQGARSLNILFRPDSPFAPVLGRIGYSPLGVAQIAVKVDTQPEGDSHGQPH